MGTRTWTERQRYEGPDEGILPWLVSWSCIERDELRLASDEHDARLDRIEAALAITPGEQLAHATAGSMNPAAMTEQSYADWLASVKARLAAFDTALARHDETMDGQHSFREEVDAQDALDDAEEPLSDNARQDVRRAVAELETRDARLALAGSLLLRENLEHMHGLWMCAQCGATASAPRDLCHTPDCPVGIVLGQAER